MRSTAFCLLLATASTGFSQEAKESLSTRIRARLGEVDRRRDGESVKSVFKPIVAKARNSVVRIRVDGKQVALGTIVGPDGWIATKASQVKGDPVCRLADGADHPARIVGVDEANDVAMLRIDAKGLASSEWETSSGVKPGQWAISAGQDDAPISLGVVSGPIRKIPLNLQMGRRAVLGISLNDGDGGAKVLQVLADGAAEKAGIKVNDVIVEFEGKSVDGREGLQQYLSQSKIGTKVRLAVRRGMELLTLEATLGDSDAAFGRQFDRQATMNRMGGALSERRGRFPAAFQHDAVLKPEDCGGPVLNLKGKVIGMNISRTGRTESYAIPVEHLRTLMFDLMSGKLAPKTAAPAKSAKAESDAKGKSESKPQPK